MRELCLCAASLALLIASGCQCCHVTEWYIDNIDASADGGVRLEHLYHPKWDLTRIGRPDWCCAWQDTHVGNHYCCKCCLAAPGCNCVPGYMHQTDWETLTMLSGMERSRKPATGEAPLIPTVPDAASKPEAASPGLAK